MVTLIVIAAIFAAFFVLEAFSGMGMGFFHSNMMSNVSSWGSHIGGCMR
ncbi:hypothetical protein HMPREF0530_2757 [Lacticaseibacillus paracasei subsp. paracasei ATCC 25302 = DSM 5622 = JCM 8130]|nr:hypothetical protein HMPREF0530_2757 [Lacticaseibacillus paracasei subsp. paracasei ATCC 25302 = DSM 5622 = JCM 8130]